jgi:hypothetical protein
MTSNFQAYYIALREKKRPFEAFIRTHLWDFISKKTENNLVLPDNVWVVKLLQLFEQ